MVNSVPAATEVGHSVSSTCFGGSAGKRKGGLLRMGVLLRQAPPGPDHPLGPRCSQEAGWCGKEEAVQGEGCLGSSFRDLMTSAMDWKGGALVSTKKRFRISSVN